jgi:hypothetical protein
MKERWTSGIQHFMSRHASQHHLYEFIQNLSETAPNRHQLMQEALVGPMRHIYGVSDKVVTMTLSSVLIAAPDIRPNWFEAGSQMIVVDTLIHNFLHRTGILQRFDVGHACGAACYRQGHCADILRLVSASINARRFNQRYRSGVIRGETNAM